ncbi:MAG: Carboxyl-terminal protease, partial [Parcubacteria group bacterium GW2011_GWF2_39_13b]
MNKKLFVPIIIVAIIASFGAGFYVSNMSRPSVEEIKTVSNAELGKAENVDFSLFWDAWKVIEDKFVNRSKLDAQKMVYGAINGMLRALGDPYTVFMPPEENKKFSEDMKGEFGGIGAEIGMRKDILTIIAPLEGSPAKAAGLLPQDKVLKVDGKSTDGMSIDEAINLIRGPKGEAVVLNIFRDGWKDAKDFKIIRDTIVIPVIKWQMKDNKVAYIQLYHFSENSASEFKKVAQEAISAGAKSVVLDMRGNPGGYLESAVDI